MEFRSDPAFEASLGFAYRGNWQVAWQALEAVETLLQVLSEAGWATPDGLYTLDIGRVHETEIWLIYSIYGDVIYFHEVKAHLTS